MKREEIEKMIKECQEMASYDIFNLSGGWSKAIDYEKYADLLEGLLRKYLSKLNDE